MARPYSQEINQAAMLAAPVFAMMGWTWGSTYPRTPSVPEIEQTYRMLLSHIKGSNKECGTGRLMVRKTELGIEFLMELA